MYAGLGFRVGSCLSLHVAIPAYDPEGHFSTSSNPLNVQWSLHYSFMSYSPHFRHDLMDMCSSLGDYIEDYTKEGPVCPPLRVPHKQNNDMSSCNPCKPYILAVSISFSMFFSVDAPRKKVISLNLKPYTGFPYGGAAGGCCYKGLEFTDCYNFKKPIYVFLFRGAQETLLLSILALQEVIGCCLDVTCALP